MHTPEETNWILANRKFVMRWLEERDGWQDSDQGIGVLTTNEGTIGTVHHHRLIDTEGYYQTGWAVSEEFCGHLHWYCNKEKRISEDWLWLPTERDVLERLEEKGVPRVLIAKTEALALRMRGLFYSVGTMGPGDKCHGETRLIALMELSKSCDSTAS